MRTREEKTDFGTVWYMDDEGGKFRFAIYQYDDDPDVIYCSNVFVSPEYREKGIGNNILSYVDSFAKKKKAKSAILRCLKSSFVYDWYLRHGYGYHSDDEENDRYVWLIKNYNINEMDAIKAKIQSRLNEGNSLNEYEDRSFTSEEFYGPALDAAVKAYFETLNLEPRYITPEIWKITKRFEDKLFHIAEKSSKEYRERLDRARKNSTDWHGDGYGGYSY